MTGGSIESHNALHCKCYVKTHMGVEPKIGVLKTPKMDGLYIMENPMNKWMILGGKPPIFGNTHMFCELGDFSFLDGDWNPGGVIYPIVGVYIPIF